MSSSEKFTSLVYGNCTSYSCKVMVVVVIASFFSCLMLSYPYYSKKDYNLDCALLRNDRKNTYEQENRGLIKFIQENYIEPPSNKPYNLTNLLEKDEDDPSIWQRKVVHKLLKEMKNGIFVDCGAHDGESLSNTLVLEKLYNWTGALIEANPQNYESLQSKNRKARTLPLCLSPYTYPKKMKFTLDDTLSKIIEDRGQKITNAVSVDCFPLYLVLLALNLTKINYFSLDVEGSELDVLKTVPWNNVDITVFTVEFNHVKEGKQAIRKYMKSHGYDTYIDGEIMPSTRGQNIDYIFAKHSYMKETFGKNK